MGRQPQKRENHREGTLEIGVEIPLQPLADPEPHRCRVRPGGSAESSRWEAEGWVEMLGLTQAHPEWSAPAHQEPFSKLRDTRQAATHCRGVSFSSKSSCHMLLSLNNSNLSLFLKKYLFIYLAAPGLSCGTWDLRCGTWDLLVTARGI